MNFSNRNLFLLIGGLAFLLLVLLVVPLIQSNRYRERFTQELQNLKPDEKIELEKNAAEIENSTRLTIAQIVGGIGLLIGLYLTYQNVKAAQDNAKTAQENVKTAQESLRITEKNAQENLRLLEEGKLTERFSKAVEMLGSEKLDVRIGGIYALERISRDSKHDHWTVMEVLTAFVRENAPYNPDKKKDSLEQTKPREDIQAAMTVIGRRKWSETETQWLNLREVDLFQCNLYKANLIKANLSEANLSEANLKEADLIGAMLIGAIMIKTYCSGANLSKANLYHADWNEIFLFEANLDGTYLRHTKNLTLKSILDAKHCEEALLPEGLREKLKKQQAKQAK